MDSARTAGETFHFRCLKRSRAQALSLGMAATVTVKRCLQISILVFAMHCLDLSGFFAAFSYTTSGYSHDSELTRAHQSIPSGLRQIYKPYFRYLR